MDADPQVWAYEGPAELAGVVRAKVVRLPVDVKLAITVEDERYGDVRLPALRSWEGTASVARELEPALLDGRCELILPTGQSGEVYVHAEVSHAEGPLETALQLQGVGEAPWLSTPG